MRDDSTGTEAASASETTLAPPSSSDVSTSSRQRASRRKRLPARQFPQPVVARVDRGLGSGLFRHVVAQRRPHVQHPQARGRRQQPGRQRRAERILDRPQMPQDAHLEQVRARGRPYTGGGHGLVDDPRLGPHVLRQLRHAQRLQDDQPRRQVQGPAGIGVGVDGAVQVGAGQGQDQRSVGVARPVALQGREAAQRVQGHQQVAALAAVFLADGHAPAQLAQDARPAQGGDAVALARAGRRGGDQANLQDHGAQVRKPANTSRRSGR